MRFMLSTRQYICIYIYNYSHTTASSSKVLLTAFNSCPSLWSSSPTSCFEFILVTWDDILVPQVVMTTTLNQLWEAPVFWHFNTPCLGLESKSMPSKVLITVESVIEYTLHLGLTMVEDDLAVMEGDLSSSLTSALWPWWQTMHSTCISEMIWGEHDLPLFKQLFFSFQHRLYAWVTGPLQGDSFRQIQASQG